MSDYKTYLLKRHETVGRRESTYSVAVFGRNYESAEEVRKLKNIGVAAGDDPKGLGLMIGSTRPYDSNKDNIITIDGPKRLRGETEIPVTVQEMNSFENGLEEALMKVKQAS